MSECKWCYDEVCVNSDCPFCTEYCPLSDFEGVCKYEDRNKEINKETKNMKRLFISCPMKGRTEENIKKSMEQMHKIAEIVFDQELEVIPSFIEDAPPENANQAVYFLGKAIQLMSEADFFIGVEYSRSFKGCNIEKNVAINYGIKFTIVDMHDLMPDAAEIERGSSEACAICG